MKRSQFLASLATLAFVKKPDDCERKQYYRKIIWKGQDANQIIHVDGLFKVRGTDLVAVIKRHEDR